MISFLTPWALAGLGAAVIPLLLHLISRREPPTVVFPAVRYLLDTARQHQRRLKLQHWLLLLIRTGLIVLLVLAAAGPSAPLGRAASHAPSALVLVLDNSASSGAVVSGTRMLNTLKKAALQVLARATSADALWLLDADGIPRRGDPPALARLVDNMQVSSRRVDLGAALGLAGEVLAAESRPGEIVLVSDLQASALSAAELRHPLLVVRPEELPVPNVGIAAVELGPQPWTPAGGRVVTRLEGDVDHPVPLSISVAGRSVRQALGQVGAPTQVTLPPVPVGWWVVTASLDPDELRLDDERWAAVWVAPIARVRWSPEEHYLAAACEVLESGGRLRKGDEVTLGSLGPGPSIVEPPQDAAQVGALNRALARRGVDWRFGILRLGSELTDSGDLLARERVTRRYALEATGSGQTGVVVRVGGSPWIVRSGETVLLGSRLDPDWTTLPFSSGFVPFVDAMVNRLARGQLAPLDAAPGDVVLLPDQVSQVRSSERTWPTDGGAALRAPEPGLYFLLRDRDTVGVLAVNVDPRESRLERASDREVTRLWPRARLAGTRDAGSAAFTGVARADLRGPLLALALGLGLAEVFLASAWKRRS